ncbi:FG-GAP repeat domain-containing protein [Nannocystis radixulma]|uniref:VCBS repeat-containing protein n=1 Tax=Nannocystis radixulma TaxID=2995305 RepID=A0ABT5BL60_9BACT|nr:VCBS repeat-containing protein [Nannocystis radixulma]MDC0673686.1 VCBS repeat-containing protein [Nannocystis radixulma]
MSADLDGDAREELVVSLNEVSLPSQTGVAVLGNLGGATFAPPVVTAAGSTLDMQWGNWSIASADFDGDGAIDVTVADYEHDAVQVLRNLGDGTFAPAVSYFGMTDPRTVVPGDFDGDGKTDIVALTYQSEIVFLRNLGDGTFSVAGSVATGASSFLARPGAAADLDGDGDLDLALTSNDTDSVIIRFGAGDGTFPASTIIPTAEHPSSVAAVDFDADGHVDLAIGHGGNDSGVQLLWSLGGGNFDAPQHFAIDASYDDLVLVYPADMDDDGHVDIVTTSPESHQFNVLHNTGVGDFFDHGTWHAGQSPISLVARDVDEDGRRDLVVSNRDESTLTILRQHEDGSFGESPPRLDAVSVSGVLLEDVTGDGKIDVIDSATGGVRVLADDGAGNYLPAVQYPASVHAYTTPKSADLDADGDSDLLTWANQTVTVLLNQGDGTFTPTDYPGVPSSDILPGEFDGDGVLDLVSINSTSVALLHGLGGGTFGPPEAKLTGGYPAVSEAADLDGDGDLDLALQPEGQPHRIAVMRNDGAGGFTTTTVHTNSSSMWLLVRDLSGDGKPDLAVSESYTTLSVLVGNGDGTFLELGSHDMGVLQGKRILSADLDNDGVLDLVTPDEKWSYVGVLLGQGGGAFAPVVTYDTHANKNSYGHVVLADLDGDAALDLVAAGSALALVHNNGDGTFGPSTAYASLFNRGLAARDMNGDGKAEVVYGNSKGLFHVSSTCR